MTPIEEMARGFYLSRYQRRMGLPELQDAWDRGYRYVHIRSSVGQYADAYFEQHWINAGKIGFLRSIWHYLTADDWKQARIFYGSVRGKIPEMGFYGDFEAKHLTIEKCNMFLLAADDLLETTVNYYSGAWWLNMHKPTNWESEGRKLWLCSIGNEIVLPRGVDNWEFWQHGCGRPRPFPCDICLDRYNGTEEDLYAKYQLRP